MEAYLRVKFLKFGYRLGYESLCREVSDSITWRRFCRIPLDGAVPHPTTSMKLSTRCGSVAVQGLNEALLVKAAEAKVLRTSRVRADTTGVPANVCYPADSGLLAKAIRWIRAAGVSEKRKKYDQASRSRTRHHATPAALQDNRVDDQTKSPIHGFRPKYPNVIADRRMTRDTEASGGNGPVA